MPTASNQPPRLSSAGAPIRFDRDAAPSSSTSECLNRSEESVLHGDARRHESLRRLASAGGAVTVFSALLVIVGWIADIRFFRSLSTQWISMVFNTAVSFVLLGTALVLSMRGAGDRRWRLSGVACAAGATLLAILTLLEYVLGCDLGIDRLLFSAEVSDFVAPVHPGRMASPTAVNFILLGATILGMNFVGKRGWRWAQVLPITAAYVALLIVLGYIHDVRLLLEIGPGSTVALHTALLFLLLAASILMVRPDQGLMGVVNCGHTGGMMARRVLPAALIVPLALGIMHLAGLREGYFDTPLGVALTAIVTMIIFAGYVIWSARSLNVAEAERMEAERKSRNAAAAVAAANENIKQSEERYRSILDTALDAVVDINAAGELTGWNPQAEAVFGWRRDEALGQTLASTIIPPAQRDAYRRGLRRFLETGVGPVLNKRIEITALHHDGHEFPIELSINPIALGDGYSFSAFVRDITERKRAEEGLREFAAALSIANESLRDVNEELRRRNVELDEFTFIASHDLQEPLRKLIAFGELLPKDLGKVLSEAAGKDLDFITDAARRMRTLVQDLLALSRAGRAPIARQRVSLENCADRALLDQEDEIERTGAEITRDELPDVLGDPTLLTQLYQNLIGNALKFAGPSHRPVVHLTCERKDDQWILGVRDNGIGIKPEYYQQIFAPFKRLHGRGEYQGTGIGLAICRKAAERHGGRIWVESELGEGAHFKFSLSIESESATCSGEQESRPSSSSLRMIPAIKS